MKPFDLEAALKGAPVVLLNGRKAYVLADTVKLGEFETIYHNDYPLVVLVSGAGLNMHMRDGSYNEDPNNSQNIIGMWEDPPRTITVGCYTFPAPVIDVKALPIGTAYWYIKNMTEVARENWSGELQDKYRLIDGLIYLSKNDAATAAAAIEAIRKGYF